MTPDEDGYPPFGVEGLWAKVKPNGHFILDSIPFYASGIGPGDEVSAILAPNGELWFESLIKSGGASVFRIHARDDDTIQRVRSALLELGCPSEIDAKTGVVAFEVPVDGRVAPVLDFLMSGQEAGEFDFEEGVLRHALPDE